MPTQSVALTAAAEAALRAPSIFNTQPWHWHVTADALELSADPARHLPVVDPDHRLSTVSCGIALHHARTALAAEGRIDDVTRLPDAARPDLLARITITGTHQPAPEDVRHYETTLIRHTDRRLFTDQPVPAEALDRLRTAAAGRAGERLGDVEPGTGDRSLSGQAALVAVPPLRDEQAEVLGAAADPVSRICRTPRPLFAVRAEQFDPDWALRLGQAPDLEAPPERPHSQMRHVPQPGGGPARQPERVNDVLAVRPRLHQPGGH